MRADLKSLSIGVCLILLFIVSCKYQRTYVAFGDSITKGTGDDNPTDGVGYPPILAQLLSSANTSYTIHNAGQLNKKSEWGAQQIGTILAQYPNASTILIQFGTNDARDGVNPSDFQSHMQAIITAVLNAGKKPLIAKIPFLYSDCMNLSNCTAYNNPKDAAKNKLILSYNHIIESLIDNNNIEIETGVRFNPPDLLGYFRAINNDSHDKPVEFSDYYHPDGDGYAAMAQLWLNALRGEGGRFWRTATGDKIWSSAGVDNDGRVIVGSNDGKLHAFGADGSPIWAYATGDDVISSPLIGQAAMTYVGSNDQYLHAVHSSGSQAWKFKTKGAVYSSPAQAADGTIYVGSWGQHLYAVHPNGTLKWKKKFSNGVRSCPAVGCTGNIYIGSMDCRLYAFDANGNQLWVLATHDLVNSSPAIQCEGSVDKTVYVGSLDGHLYAVDAQNGTLKWKTFLFGVFSSPAIGPNGTIYVGSQAPLVWAIRPDGTILWSFATSKFVTSSPAVGSDGTLYIGDEAGQVYAISPDGKLRWAATTGGTIHASPTISNSGRLYIGSADRNLYAFKIGSQGPAGSCWPMFRHDARNTGCTAP
jgi:outer membrane protein assembly factor BamB